MVYPVVTELFCHSSDKLLGGTCTPNIADECSDPNAECLNYGTGTSMTVCTCKSGSYDDNGFTGSGNCQESKNFLSSYIHVLYYTNIDYWVIGYDVISTREYQYLQRG